MPETKKRMDSTEGAGGRIWAGLLLFAALWCAFTYEAILSPWIGGFDSVTRLYRIDQTIVSIRGNPWLPLLQIIMQGVHEIADVPQLYKGVVAVLTLTGMLVCLYLLAVEIHAMAAAFFALGFFALQQWHWIATSIYMEGLCFLFCMLALAAARRGRRNWCALLLIAASLTRPEVLLASPIVLLYHLWFFQDWKRSFILALCFVPAFLFYWLQSGTAGEFASPLHYDWEIAARLLWKLGFAVRVSWFLQSAALLAAGGLVVLCCIADFLPKHRRMFLGAAAAFIGFYAVFVLVLPLAHDFSQGGTRPTILLVLPLMLYASIFAAFCYTRFPEGALRIFLVVASVLLTLRIVENTPRTPWSYRSAQRLLHELRAAGHQPPGKLRVCTLDSLSVSDGAVYHLYYEPVLLYLRFAGWEQERVACEEPAVMINAERQAAERPLLRVFDQPRIPPGLGEVLSRSCQRAVVLRNGRDTFGRVCF